MWPIRGLPICTKRRADVRFSRYSENLISLRTGYAGKGDRVLFELYHLAEGDRLTDILAAVCKRDYDPAVDIDRYLLDCFGVNRDIDRCPVFEAVRAALEKERLRRVNLGNDAGDYARCADVGCGDGYVGPILGVFSFDPEFIPSQAELEKICLGCDKCRNSGCDQAENANQVIKQELKQRTHGGIIAFLRRMFGRRSQTKGKVK